MEYVRTDGERGHLFRCPDGGCPLKGRKGVRYCFDELWVSPEENVRVVGIVARGSAEWVELYARWEIIEQLFEMHAAMSLLTYVATMLMRLSVGDYERMRHMRVKGR